MGVIETTHLLGHYLERMHKAEPDPVEAEGLDDTVERMDKGITGVIAGQLDILTEMRRLITSVSNGQANQPERARTSKRLRGMVAEYADAIIPKIGGVLKTQTRAYVNRIHASEARKFRLPKITSSARVDMLVESINRFDEEFLRRYYADVEARITATFEAGGTYDEWAGVEKQAGLLSADQISDLILADYGVYVEKATPKGYKSGADLGKGIVAEDYLGVTSDAIAGNARSVGSTSAWASVGIAQLKVKAVIDGRTTQICRGLDGTIISTETVLDHYTNVLDTKTPDQYLAKNAWPSYNKSHGLHVWHNGQRISIPPGTSSNRMSALGVGLPPYHGRCRSTTEVDYSGGLQTVGGVEPTGPTIPPELDKALQRGLTTRSSTLTATDVEAQLATMKTAHGKIVAADEGGLVADLGDDLSDANLDRYLTQEGADPGRYAIMQNSIGGEMVGRKELERLLRTNVDQIRVTGSDATPLKGVTDQTRYMSRVRSTNRREQANMKDVLADYDKYYLDELVNAQAKLADKMGVEIDKLPANAIRTAQFQANSAAMKKVGHKYQRYLSYDENALPDGKVIAPPDMSIVDIPVPKPVVAPKKPAVPKPAKPKAPKKPVEPVPKPTGDTAPLLSGDIAVTNKMNGMKMSVEGKKAIDNIVDTASKVDDVLDNKRTVSHGRGLLEKIYGDLPKNSPMRNSVVLSQSMQVIGRGPHYSNMLIEGEHLKERLNATSGWQSASTMEGKALRGAVVRNKLKMSKLAQNEFREHSAQGDDMSDEAFYEEVAAARVVLKNLFKDGKKFRVYRGLAIRSADDASDLSKGNLKINDYEANSWTFDADMALKFAERENVHGGVVLFRDIGEEDLDEVITSFLSWGKGKYQEEAEIVLMGRTKEYTVGKDMIPLKRKSGEPDLEAMKSRLEKADVSAKPKTMMLGVGIGGQNADDRRQVEYQVEYIPHKTK